MVDDKQCSSDVLTQPNIYFAEPLQIAITRREDNVEDVNDGDIGIEINKQVPFKDLNPPKARLNHN